MAARQLVAWGLRVVAIWRSAPNGGRDLAVGDMLVATTGRALAFTLAAGLTEAMQPAYNEPAIAIDR